jgi:hypothetical protein
MSAHNQDPFAGIPELADDLAAKPSEFANASHAMMAGADAETVKEYVEKCTACNGTGRFHSYTGRVVGECFKCNGAGKRSFKTSPEARAKAKKRTAQKKAAEQEAKISAFADWHFALTDEQRAASGWLIDVTRYVPFWMNNEVAQSLIDQFRNSKPWSGKQLEMVMRWHQKAVERQTAKAEQKARELTPCAVSEKFVELFGLFANAKAAQKAKPILRAEGLRISEAKEGSRNEGCLYVTDAEGHWEDRTYLGKITPSGEFVRSKACTNDQAAAVESVALNPLEAALNHGRVTGQCSCCGRELTNHKSVEDGIGPICRDKWGL